MPEREQPDQPNITPKVRQVRKQSKAPSKPPKGSKKNPWYRVPEHSDKWDKGIKHQTCFIYLDKNGIWKVPQLPATYPVRTEITY